MNTNEKGRITEAKVLSKLVAQGHNVLVPFGGVGRYDLLIDTGQSFHRVECKTGRLQTKLGSEKRECLGCGELGCACSSVAFCHRCCSYNNC